MSFNIYRDCIFMATKEPKQLKIECHSLLVELVLLDI